MCILALAWRTHRRWHLVMAGNRDERHDRPAAPLERWAQQDHLIAGRDLRSGGTWLGVSELGRFAVVTNLPSQQLPAPDAPSRGALVTNFLIHGELDREMEGLSAFSPFNLIVADGVDAEFLSNRPTPSRQRLEPGLYGLSNGGLDEPWSKTLRLKAALGRWIDGESENVEALFEALRSEEGEDRDWISAGRDSSRSPIFIRHPLYGTRCSTIVAIDAEGKGRIVERRFSPEGEAVGDSEQSFSWAAPPA